jgi:hypothetical protein
MSKPAGKIDLAKFREANKEQRERVKAGPEGHTIQQRAVIRLIEDQRSFLSRMPGGNLRFEY